ncbi:hypothetical protein C8Q72DRAFT_190806 [Fomitopsis betulina]|nr:hypothetical protein C8Q72DRAFT_190806 [Fomitopsis betulina]
MHSSSAALLHPLKPSQFHWHSLLVLALLVSSNSSQLATIHPSVSPFSAALKMSIWTTVVFNPRHCQLVSGKSVLEVATERTYSGTRLCPPTSVSIAPLPRILLLVVGYLHKTQLRWFALRLIMPNACQCWHG